LDCDSSSAITAVHEVVEEEGGKIKEWNEEDKMEQIGDVIGDVLGEL